MYIARKVCNVRVKICLLGELCETRDYTLWTTAEFLIKQEVACAAAAVLQMINQHQLFHFVSYDKVSSGVVSCCFMESLANIPITEQYE